MSDGNWRRLDDDDEPLDEQQQEALRKAYTDFVKNFMDYIRQVDPRLFKQAKDYAMDYSNNDLVQFFDVDKEKDK
jgi:hypothetical protein